MRIGLTFILLIITLSHCTKDIIIRLKTMSPSFGLIHPREKTLAIHPIHDPHDFINIDKAIPQPPTLPFDCSLDILFLLIMYNVLGHTYPSMHITETAFLVIVAAWFIGEASIYCHSLQQVVVNHSIC
eukprot:g31715.t1